MLHTSRPNADSIVKFNDSMKQMLARGFSGVIASGEFSSPGTGQGVPSLNSINEIAERYLTTRSAKPVANLITVQTEHGTYDISGSTRISAKANVEKKESYSIVDYIRRWIEPNQFGIKQGCDKLQWVNYDSQHDNWRGWRLYLLERTMVRVTAKVLEKKG